MKQVIVRKFGGTEVLEIEEVPTPDPGPGEVRIAVTCIGLNHADLMTRRGEYRLMSGDPPFVPGVECGGIVDAVGADVTSLSPGRRVILGYGAPRVTRANPASPTPGGTYRSHYVAPADQFLPAPDNLPDHQLGSLWLSYLTAWGCLAWKHGVKAGDFVGLPAASSSVALASAQVARELGAIPIGLTTSAGKADLLRALPEAPFEHLVFTRNAEGADRDWSREILRLTSRHGMDVFFDPVAAGPYLDREIRALAMWGTVWIYGLLGQPGIVDVTPLIRKHASIRGWVLGEMAETSQGREALVHGAKWILDRFESGVFRQHVGGSWRLDDVRLAHAEMERGVHVGKLVMVP